MSSKNGNGHKNRVEYSTMKTRAQIADQLEGLLKSFRNGEIAIQHGLQSVELCVAPHVRFAFEARCKDEQQSLHITLDWDKHDERDQLIIGTSTSRRNRRALNADTPTVIRRPVEDPPYEEWTRDELYQRARDMDIEGRSDMTKDELVTALRQC